MAANTPLKSRTSTKLSVTEIRDSDFDSDLHLDPDDGEESRLQYRVQALIKLSLYGNLILFTVKLYASIATRSLSVIGSMLDSFLDLLTQLVIYFVERCSKTRDRSEYPAGLSRLEPIGVIFCASIMGMAALELIFHSILSLLQGKYELWFNFLSISILVTAIFVKVILYVLCSGLSKKSSFMLTLAEDHRNDVLTNSMALATGLTAHYMPSIWWMDPTGALLISIYIAVSWVFIAKEQVEMLVGKAAPPELVANLRNIAERYHPQMKLDIIRVYHFGARFLVELEMVLPKDKTVKWAHDRSLKLQKLLEQHKEVERAYVHCDWKERKEDEHDWEFIRQKFHERAIRLRGIDHSYQKMEKEFNITMEDEKKSLLNGDDRKTEATNKEKKSSNVQSTVIQVFSPTKKRR